MKKLREKILIVIFVFLLYFAVFYFQDSLKNITYFIFSHFQKTIFKLTCWIEKNLEMFFEISKLKKEKEALEIEVKKLSIEKEELLKLKKENEELRKALGIGLEKDFKLKMANFVAKDVSGDTIIIDKGKIDGLKENQVVITSEKFLVGKILKVYENFSKVRLFTDKDFSFNVKISEKEIEALAKGEGNFTLKVHFIPKDKEISLGDKVFTSHLGGKFPDGILVGEIEKIEKSDLEFYQKAKIKPAIDFENLDFLFVILNS